MEYGYVRFAIWLFARKYVRLIFQARFIAVLFWECMAYKDFLVVVFLHEGMVFCRA